MRKFVKSHVNFALIYGAHPEYVIKKIGDNRKVITDFLNDFGVLDFHYQIKKKYASLGYLPTMFGRRIQSKEILSDNQIYNLSLQSAGNDAGMVAIKKLYYENYQIVKFVHDEIVVEISEQDIEVGRVEIMKKIMIEEPRKWIKGVDPKLLERIPFKVKGFISKDLGNDRIIKEIE